MFLLKFDCRRELSSFLCCLIEQMMGSTDRFQMKIQCPYDRIGRKTDGCSDGKQPLVYGRG